MIRVRFLGTAATQPYTSRSASAILLQLANLRILLDVGQNVTRQLLRYKETLDVDAILITHLHGDHFYGLFGLIDTLQKNQRTRDLPIYGPSSILRIKSLLDLMHKKLSFRVQFIVLPANQRLPIGSVSVQATPMAHTVMNYGYLLSIDIPARLCPTRMTTLGLSPGPWCKTLLSTGTATVERRVITLADVQAAPATTRSVFYSGDTRYQRRLIPSADIIIHQCSYGKDPIRAKARMHTQFTEIAADAAQFTTSAVLLTHISQKFDYAIRGGQIKLPANYVIAHDGFQYTAS